MLKNTNSDEKRNFERVFLNKPVKFASEGKCWKTEMLDVSMKGILVKKPADYNYKKGVKVHVEIKLGEIERIRMNAHTSHCEEGRMGLTWDHIDSESFAHLRRLLELNIGDADMIKRELGELI